jgi:hypothetical protein
MKTGFFNRTHQKSEILQIKIEKMFDGEKTNRTSCNLITLNNVANKNKKLSNKIK